MKKIPLSFYSRKDVVEIAKDLIGKIIVTNFDGSITSGRIVETEAYVALTDKASHSFGGKRTAKNEHMYASAGTAYVYICYGLHQMMNIVTNDKDIPDAVLIRAVEPIDGIDVMLKRTGKPTPDKTLTRGPGNVGKALGIFKHHSGNHLLGDKIYLMDDHFKINKEQIGTSARIGVESAGADSLLPYRFYLKGNKYVSGKNK
ncbi:DNA-3-methyladenine glycosylase [Ginsengibacter hankyongi]|uniref:Putative 3-methyladenine DNA glycosylase n=1 Tax=Ginsengibacter hankyongi TaxID=2607284 RepID=A0A5J5IJY1_9BACT|nr:DNA-3-methyladenine glycosylase [Ginsengibacter hankyongi]KAA9039319.1 DNA-3-methyladenine glycosylase [Ginsengibacter hankyongi]